MPHLILISSDTQVIDTVQSLSDYAIIHIPEVTAGNHAEILVKMVDAMIALVDTAAVQDVSFYKKIGEKQYFMPQIPVILLTNENELDSVNTFLEKPLVDFLTKPFSTMLLKYRIAQSLRREKHKAYAVANYVKSMVFDIIEPFNKDKISLLIDWYHDLSAIEADNLQLFSKPLTLLEIIKPCLEFFPDTNWILHIPENLSAVIGDEKRLRLGFYEVLSMAYIYNTNNTSINIYASKINNEIYITVQDNGFGLRPEELKRIFYQSDLGLKVTRHIIEKHGGRIWIESEEKKGTTVHFTLPAADNTPG